MCAWVRESCEHNKYVRTIGIIYVTICSYTCEKCNRFKYKPAYAIRPYPVYSFSRCFLFNYIYYVLMIVFSILIFLHFTSFKYLCCMHERRKRDLELISFSFLMSLLLLLRLLLLLIQPKIISSCNPNWCRRRPSHGVKWIFPKLCWSYPNFV